MRSFLLFFTKLLWKRRRLEFGTRKHICTNGCTMDTQKKIRSRSRKDVVGGREKKERGSVPLRDSAVNRRWEGGRGMRRRRRLEIGGCKHAHRCWGELAAGLTADGICEDRHTDDHHIKRDTGSGASCAPIKPYHDNSCCAATRLS
jgi:hypothetical protein